MLEQTEKIRAYSRNKLLKLNVNNLVFDQQVFSPHPEENLCNGNRVFLAICDNAVDVLFDVVDMADLTSVNVAFG